MTSATVLSVHPVNPQGRHITRAVEVLRSGGILIYPTDTVYGLGCSIFRADAIGQVYQIKQQDRSKPFSFICSDLSHISEYAVVSNQAFRLMKRLIPGPYTFVLPASRMKQVSKSMMSKRKTVGIRVPDNAVCQALIRGMGHPLLSASVTDDQGEIMNAPEEIAAIFGSRVGLILESGNGALEVSTILDLTGEHPVVVRQGKGDTGFLNTA
ncbi:MAG TPA: L-threonylcarbamoyladenylate synthase [Bacteroidota bacterium]|nr:L-threonylcarbamoyladenylate synthase [Bacteroidota bacterium]